MDAISEQRLAEVCPELAAMVHLLAADLALQNINLRVTQGLRSFEAQNTLYQQGRTTSGEVVTNAPAGHSWHEFGLAVDVVPMDPLPDWNIAHPVWHQIVTTGESVGLYSGDEFSSIKDEPHFQLTGRFGVSPNDEVRTIYANGGMEAVWREAGLA
jgi:peptidoglycan L-alanyl-D-glutamate endopeptidase CwlK